MQLQGDVVAPLALAVQQDALGLVALEAQRDHVLQRRHGLLVEPVEQRAPAVEVGHVGLWKADEADGIVSSHGALLAGLTYVSIRDLNLLL